MCGRFVTPDEAAFERHWQVGRHNWRWHWKPSYNVAPSATVPIIRLENGQTVVDGARWGLIPHWWKQPKPPMRSINARSEEAGTKPMWRHAMRSERCLIPAAGWYEWSGTERTLGTSGRQVKQPYYIHADDDVIAFAGLWSVWKPPEGDPVLSCSILTRDAAPGIASIHNRMPVVLPVDHYEQWLDVSVPASELLTAAREDFAGQQVSPTVNNTRNDGPELIVPTE